MKAIRPSDTAAKQSALQSVTLHSGTVSSLLLITSIFLCGFLTMWGALSCTPDHKLAFMHYTIARTIVSQTLCLSSNILAFLIGFNYFNIIKIFQTKILIAVACFCMALAVAIMSVVIAHIGIKLPVCLLPASYIIERLGLLIVVLFVVSGKDATRVEQSKENRGNL